MANFAFRVWKMGEPKHGILELTPSPLCRWKATGCASWFESSCGVWTREYVGGPSRGSYRPHSLILRDLRGETMLVLPSFLLWLDKTLIPANIGKPMGPELQLQPSAKFKKTKDFRIQITGSFNVSYGFAQMEAMSYTIEDIDAKTQARYQYDGFGPTLSVPLGKSVSQISKAANRVNSVAGKGGFSPFEGPWNDFSAPGWMSAHDFEGKAAVTTPANVGMGTSTGWTIFDFGESETGGFLVNIPAFQGGESVGLPSMGASSGSMVLVKK